MADEIAASHSKLQLLQKTHDLEEKEKERLSKKSKARDEKANEIRAQNTALSATTHNEVMFRREESERRELVAKMKKYATELGLTSIVDILNNYEGTLTKMRRNVHGTYDIVRSNNDKLVNNECDMKNLISMVKDVKEDMKKYTFHMRMDYCDVGQFFPLQSDQDLQKFMDRQHPDWHLRMKGFNHLLYTTVTKNKRRFGGALLHTLFSRQFIPCHRWPLPRYVHVLFFLH